MNAYWNLRHATFSALIVASLAGLISEGLRLDQQIIYERDLGRSAEGGQVHTLPEIVVTARRIGS